MNTFSLLKVFILAAGLGERLRPITDHIPKPLLPICGTPMLELVLERTAALSPSSTGINLHYKKESIEQWIAQSVFNGKVTLFPEDPILGTGGALKNAEGFLNDSVFLVHNADILSDIDLEKLLAFHKNSGNIATLAVHHCPEFNNLVVDQNGHLREIGAMCSLCRPPGSRLLAFTGISVYSPEFLHILPEGASSVVHSWTKAVSAGEQIGTYDVSGCEWTDIGTPASYARAVFRQLRKSGHTVYIHPSVENCRNVEIDGNTVIERGSILHKGFSLRNCIVLPETRLGTEETENEEPECFLTLFWGKGRGESFPESAGNKVEEVIANCIHGQGFSVPLKESDLFDAAAGGAFHIGTGGSDRRYFRIKRDSGTVVLMECPQDDPDFQRHIAYTHFFLKNSIPVPGIIEADTGKKTALFEDVGDLSLFSWLACPRGRDQTTEVYRRVIDIAVQLHSTATGHMAECAMLQDRLFDYNHFRWETRYFIERFVEGLRHIKIARSAEIDGELHTLASRADSFHKTIVHRDFQSQNIMITKGGIPRLLDFQGARIGPPAYDIASLLWDPYYRLEDRVRKGLLDYYIEKMAKKAEWFTGRDFSHTILPCRLQRHMQALGAYGFLSVVKGKKHFLTHVPEGLRLLREDLSEAKKEYPALDDLVKKL